MAGCVSILEHRGSSQVEQVPAEAGSYVTWVLFRASFRVPASFKSKGLQKVCGFAKVTGLESSCCQWVSDLNCFPLPCCVKLYTEVPVRISCHLSTVLTSCLELQTWVKMLQDSRLFLPFQASFSSQAPRTTGLQASGPGVGVYTQAQNPESHGCLQQKPDTWI